MVSKEVHMCDDDAENYTCLPSLTSNVTRLTLVSFLPRTQASVTMKYNASSPPEASFSGVFIFLRNPTPVKTNKRQALSLYSRKRPYELTSLPLPWLLRTKVEMQKRVMMTLARWGYKNSQGIMIVQQNSL